MKYRITSESQRRTLIEDIEAADLPLWVEVLDGRDRTLEQNRTLHLWFQEIAKGRGDVTAEEVKAECKLFWGVPILRAEDEEFRAVYDESIKPLPYEVKLRAVTILPVSSRMNVSQSKRFMAAIWQEWSGKVRMTDPGEPAVMRGAA